MVNQRFTCTGEPVFAMYVKQCIIAHFSLFHYISVPMPVMDVLNVI